MKRRNFRFFLWVCLLIAAIFAAWTWLRPYAWNPDPTARCEILETLVTRDQSFIWVNVHLKVTPGMTHDLEKPVHLESTGGLMHEPADTTFVGTIQQTTTEIWLKFWLEPTQLTGPLVLHLNDGKLIVKASNGIPVLGASSSYNFTSNHW
jgi:hypothetical protein